MDYDFIKDHALKNVWGAPRQDTQYRVVPNRLTPYHGHVRTTEVLWKKVDLPDTTSRWHVYQIGGIHPLAFNLFTKSFGWVSLAEACNRQLMIANVYTAGGIQYPLHDTYYQYTQDRNLILAVKINELIPGNINTEDITLRVYSNAFFNSVRSDGLTKQVYIEGKTLTKASDITDIEYRNTCIPDCLHRTARRYDLYSCFMKLSGKLNYPGLIGDTDQCTFDFHNKSHLFSYLFIFT